MSSSSLDNRKVVLLAGAEGPEQAKVEVTWKAACMSELIKQMLQDDGDEDEVPEIPLLEVSKDILEKVVLFLNKHRDDPMKKIEKPIKTANMSEIVDKWDADFIELDQEPLFKLILAANYLDIPDLLDLGITKFCTMIKDKDANEVKKLLNIDPSITPEEERLVREKNDWIFEVHKQTPQEGA